MKCIILNYIYSSLTTIQKFGVGKISLMFLKEGSYCHQGSFI